MASYVDGELPERIDSELPADVAPQSITSMDGDAAFPAVSVC